MGEYFFFSQFLNASTVAVKRSRYMFTNFTSYANSYPKLNHKSCPSSLLSDRSLQSVSTTLEFQWNVPKEQTPQPQTWPQQTWSQIDHFRDSTTKCIQYLKELNIVSKSLLCGRCTTNAINLQVPRQTLHK